MSASIYSNDHKFIIKQLKNARVEAGLDQKKVAEFLGKTQSYVSKMESGQRKIDIVQLKEFARLYQKPLEYFIGHEK